MSRKVTPIVEDTIEKSQALIGAIPASNLLRRANADRIVAVCKDLVTSRPAQDPVSPVVAELGQIRYGKFPASQTLLNHYPELLRVWRQAFQLVVDATAPVPTKSGNALAIADGDLQGLDSGTKARVQLALAALRESKLENDRLKKIIRDAIPAPGQEPLPRAAAASGTPHTRAIKDWLASVESGVGCLDVDAVGLRVSRRGRPGTVAMTSDVVDALRAICSDRDVRELPSLEFPSSSDPNPSALKLPFVRPVPEAPG